MTNKNNINIDCVYLPDEEKFKISGELQINACVEIESEDLMEKMQDGETPFGLIVQEFNDQLYEGIRKHLQAKLVALEAALSLEDRVTAADLLVEIKDWVDTIGIDS